MLKPLQSAIFVVTLTLLLHSVVSFAQSTTPSCLELSDKYCQELNSAENQGNLDGILLGRTKNDIKYSKYYFLKAVEKNFKKLSKDLQFALKKNQVIKKIKKHIYRKSRQNISPSDIYSDEWTSDSIDEIRTAFEQVAVDRTEKKIPGYIRQLVKDTSPESDMEYYRQLDVVWAEFFTKVWQDDPAWKEVEKKFEIVRQEYILWNEQDNSITDELRKFRNEQLKSLVLAIPGSTSNRAFDLNFRCGIDEDNAYYNSSRHQLTVCAGGFVGNEPLLTIAHEVGHSISNGRRVFKYFEASHFGQSFSQLWYNIQKGNHLSCEQWSTFKKNLAKDTEEMAPYVFDDKKFLNQFLTKELRDIPKDAELRKITNRLAKRTLNDEIRNNTISRILKKTVVLESGRSIPNASYLNPEATFRWSLLPNALITPSSHFDHYFTEEYNCLLNEKNLPETKALEAALTEARTLTAQVWKLALTIGGKFSSFNEAIDEDFAQDIEEDVVDSYASTVVARILKKVDSVAERRNLFLKSTASYCDPISFRQLYPAETNIMHKFTNALHSIGQDRRKKLLTDDIKPLLQCQ
jgi:hypothetical protein